MRKIVIAAVLACAAVVPIADAAQPVEGCQAAAVGDPIVDDSFAHCRYISTAAGGIAGTGSWRVVVHWSGDCSDEVIHGQNGWIRSSDDGGNNLEGGLAGAWAGSVNDSGYCVDVSALSPGSVVTVGNVGPVGQDDVG